MSERMGLDCASATVLVTVVGWTHSFTGDGFAALPPLLPASTETSDFLLPLELVVFVVAAVEAFVAVNAQVNEARACKSSAKFLFL